MLGAVPPLPQAVHRTDAQPQLIIDDEEHPLRILGFGTYDLARHPRVGIILDGLRAAGDDVLEVNEPLGFSTAERVEMLRRPLLLRKFVWRLLTCWARLAKRSRAVAKDGLDAVVVGYLGQFDVVLARLLHPRAVIALDMMVFGADTARDRGVTSGPRLRLLGLLDDLALRCADIVVLDTAEQVELMPVGQRGKAVVVAVGAPDTWFAADRAAARAGGQPLRVVFYGLFTPLQGAPVIGEALGRLATDAEVQVTMIGTGQDHAATVESAAGNPNVTWLDWRDAAALPEEVAAHDVCLGIFGTTPKALRVVPNKVYQGAAAGCAIVTSDTPPQRRSLGSDALFVPPGDAGALADTLRRLAADPAEVRALRDAARTAAEARYRPRTIVEPLRARLHRGQEG
jgi:glycosyltransferase involved in cell wall biosynthesis